MNIWSRLFGAKKPEVRSGYRLSAVSPELGQAFGLMDSPTRSGVRVSEQTALTLSVVWRAARVVSESVGLMPLKLYRRTQDGREEAREHPLWPVLHDEPNREQSAVDFLSLMQWWAVLWGNSYAECQRDGAGRVVALWPVPPWTCHPVRDSAGELAYEVRGEQSVTLPAEDVFHIKGPSGDGSEGYRLVQLARESLGFTLAAERFGASFFGNAARPSGVLETAGQLSEPARENLRKSWSAMYQGVDRVGAVPVLEEGMSFKPFSVTNEEGQYTETRQHQVYEVCRWIGVDPIFVYEYGRATWNNAEAQTRNFLQFSLNPWLRRWESELSRKCVLPSERAVYFPEFVREAVVQMDTKTQHEVWGMGVDKGWYTVDEVRRWLNLPPKPEPEKEADGTSITAD